MERFKQLHGDMEVVLCDSPEAVAKDADAVVLATEWQQYRDLAWDQMAASMRNKVVLDGRNALNRERLQAAGFRYLTLAG